MTSTLLAALLLLNQPAPPPDDFTRRFPQGEPERPAPEPAGNAEVVPDPTRTTSPVEDPVACNDVPAAARLECPLDGHVTAIGRIPTGARLTLASGKGDLAPDRLRQVLGCQASMAWVRPQSPPPCPFLTTDTRFEVRASKGKGGKTIVDVKTANENLDPGILRKRIEVALRPPAKQSGK
jgi:hypothetical protein